jgi:hypothetical protein
VQQERRLKILNGPPIRSCNSTFQSPVSRPFELTLPENRPPEADSATPRSYFIYSLEPTRFRIMGEAARRFPLFRMIR